MLHKVGPLLFLLVFSSLASSPRQGQPGYSVRDSAGVRTFHS